MTRQEVKDLQAIIVTYYPMFEIREKNERVASQMRQERIDAWAVILRDDDFKVIQAALYAYVRENHEWPPNPGQLIALADSITHPEHDAEADWAAVVKAMGNSCYHARDEFDALPKIAQKAVGSVNELRRMGTTDINMDVEKSLFMRSYRILAEREKRERIIGRSILNQIEGGNRYEQIAELRAD